MPITVFTAGIMLGTEKYELKLAVNLVVIAVGVGIASYGERHEISLISCIHNFSNGAVSCSCHSFWKCKLGMVIFLSHDTSQCIR